MLTNQILPGSSCCSFLSTQLLRIQNKPLSIKVAFAIVGIFACLAIAYGCYIGISALRNRIASPERNQNPVLRDVIFFEQTGRRIPFPREQCQAAINIPNAAWVQVQCPYRTWEEVEPIELTTRGFVLNVLPSTYVLPSLPPQFSMDYHQVCANGALIEAQSKSVGDVQQEIARGEWVSIEDFARLTGLQTTKPN